MKITDPEIIRTGERDLIEVVKGDLDWGTIGEIVKQRINHSSVASTNGEIVVHDNQVAFRMDLVVKMDLSLMFDRDGVLIQGNDEDKSHGVVESSGDSPENEAAETEEHSPAEQEISSLENQNSESPSAIGEQIPPEDQTLPVPELKGSPGVEPPDFDLSDLDLAGDDLADVEDGEALDDDIDEILKESRDFWENKKNE